MNARRAAVALLPHALVRRVQSRRVDRALLARLGAVTLDPAAASEAREWRLHLLPDGALAELKTVVDIGANLGEWSLAVLTLARPRQLIAVEPQPEIAKQLRETLAPHPNASVVEAAVGNTAGEVELNMTAHSHNASILAPRTQEMTSFYGHGWNVVETIKVPQVTLDDLTAEMDEISLLKLDVQGAEAQVMDGGSETLRRTRWLLIEVGFRSHYGGDKLFPELHGELTEHGFNLASLSQPFYASGVPLWADALYERPPAAGAPFA